MRAIRLSTRMEFKLESRTEDWFNLALERGLQENMEPEDVGAELRQLGSEQKPAAILKAWESRELIAAIHPQLERRHPHYDLLGRVVRAREELSSVGLRPRVFAPIMVATLGKLNSRERSSTLSRLGFRSSEVDAVAGLEDEVQKMNKILSGRKTAQPAAAFDFLEKTPTDLMVFALAGAANAKVANKIRNYLRRWRPLRLALPGASLELEALGMARGAKFDQVMESFFQAQLLGKGRTPEDRTKLLRKLAGIKEPPKVKEEKKKPAADNNNKMKKKLVGREASAPPAEKSSGAPAVAPAAARAASAAGAKSPAKHEKGKPAARGSRPIGGKAKRARRR
jgi:tRNA nucleotidyltransferase/poly(A) polymerase